MHHIQCSEIWGGTGNIDTDVCSVGIDASVYSNAADGDRGGDIYYFSVCTTDKLTRIAIADVMGHGALVNPTSHQLYETLQANMNQVDGHHILADLNQHALREGFHSLTTAAVIAHYLNTDKLYFSYAGHHPALVKRANDNAWTELPLPDIDGLYDCPLGADEAVAYRQSEIPFHSGDMAILYTDGVIECRDSEGRIFGREGIKHVLTNTPVETSHELKEALLNAIHEFSRGDHSHDDVTFIIIKVR